MLAPYINANGVITSIHVINFIDDEIVTVGRLPVPQNYRILGSSRSVRREGGYRYLCIDALNPTSQVVTLEYRVATTEILQESDRELVHELTITPT